MFQLLVTSCHQKMHIARSPPPSRCQHLARVTVHLPLTALPPHSDRPPLTMQIRLRRQLRLKYISKKQLQLRREECSLDEGLMTKYVADSPFKCACACMRARTHTHTHTHTHTPLTHTHTHAHTHTPYTDTHTHTHTHTHA